MLRCSKIIIFLIFALFRTTIFAIDNLKNETSCFWKYYIHSGISESSNQNCFKCNKRNLKFKNLELNDQCSCYPNLKEAYCCCIFQDEIVTILNNVTTDALDVFFAKNENFSTTTVVTQTTTVTECSQRINDSYFFELLLLKLSDFTMALNGNLTIMNAYEDAYEKTNIKHDLPSNLTIICFPITCLIILILYARRKCTHKVSIIKHPENYHRTIRVEDIDHSDNN
uniref:Uncharacterized protein n=1 Tax=Panagrolaimus superbus TaxID=310955 RepID=A0A914Z3W0_9BILA